MATIVSMLIVTVIVQGVRLVLVPYFVLPCLDLSTTDGAGAADLTTALLSGCGTWHVALTLWLSAGTIFNFAATCAAP